MDRYRIVVETPKDSREKYEYDEKTKVFNLKKLLPLGMVFPYDFGFIPDTKGEDGDPLDAMVISEFKTFPGCGLECRLIGALKAQQSQGGKMIRNDRFFFIPLSSEVYAHIQSVRDLPRSQVKELLFFFVAYNEEEHKKFEPLKIVSADKASKYLKKGIKT